MQYIAVSQNYVEEAGKLYLPLDMFKHLYLQTQLCNVYIYLPFYIISTLWFHGKSLQ